MTEGILGVRLATMSSRTRGWAVLGNSQISSGQALAVVFDVLVVACSSQSI
jgi:hypothetical protein